MGEPDAELTVEESIDDNSSDSLDVASSDHQTVEQRDPEFCGQLHGATRMEPTTPPVSSAYEKDNKEALRSPNLSCEIVAEQTGQAKPEIVETSDDIPIALVPMLEIAGAPFGQPPPYDSPLQPFENLGDPAE